MAQFCVYCGAQLHEEGTFSAPHVARVKLVVFTSTSLRRRSRSNRPKNSQRRSSWPLRAYRLALRALNAAVSGLLGADQ